MSLEMAHKVILPPKKNYIPQFLKQRDINSYYHVHDLLPILGLAIKTRTKNPKNPPKNQINGILGFF
jgi:hypothetical protein